MGEQYYIYVGCAEGQFEIQDGKNKGEKQSYANMYVLTPVSDYVSDDYKATGFKAEKMKCASPEVWKDLSIGEKCKLYTDPNTKKVVLATSLGEIIDLS